MFVLNEHNCYIIITYNINKTNYNTKMVIGNRNQ